jgi:hypothetical protein
MASRVNITPFKASISISPWTLTDFGGGIPTGVPERLQRQKFFTPLADPGQNTQINERVLLLHSCTALTGVRPLEFHPGRKGQAWRARCSCRHAASRWEGDGKPKNKIVTTMSVRFVQLFLRCSSASRFFPSQAIWLDWISSFYPFFQHQYCNLSGFQVDIHSEGSLIAVESPRIPYYQAVLHGFVAS